MRLALFALALVACKPEGEEGTLGFSQPLRVEKAEFREGALPGLPPVEADAAVLPNVTAVETSNLVVFPGQLEKQISGRLSADSVALGIRFADLGTGWWVLPAGPPDVSVGAEKTYALEVELARDLPIGLHELRVAAIDDQGKSGTQGKLGVCIVPPIPDNLNACDPSIEPPAAVLSLTWNDNVDLDLGLVAPNGKVLTSKHPSTALATDAGIQDSDLADPATGKLDHDSNAACVIDGLRRENVVFQAQPPNGLYQVYANLFDACGESSVTFDVTLYRAEPRPDGAGKWLVPHDLGHGVLTSFDANGGSSPGLFVTEFAFQ
jgi:hypothetical protein